MTVFLASPLGRFLRFSAGVMMIVYGYYTATLVGVILAVIGLEPLFASIFDFSLVGVFTGKPIRGVEVRSPQQPV